MAGTELGKATNLAHHFYTQRMGVHGHTGRAVVETVAEVARNHPNLVGIGMGLIVEQLLVEEKRRHDAHVANGAYAPHAPFANSQVADAIFPPAPVRDGEGAPARNHLADPHSTAKQGEHHLHLPELHSPIRLSTLRPGKVAVEVFGGILLLKLASTGAKIFRHKRQEEVWFAPAARVRLWSGTIGAYYFVKSLRSPKLSAWRNAAVALFLTDALKPVLRAPKLKRGQIRTAALPVALRAPEPTPVIREEPTPDPVHQPFTNAPATTRGIEPGGVSTLGQPKPDPRPMPVWPSQITRTEAALPEPVPATQSAPVMPPIDPFDDRQPPG